MNLFQTLFGFHGRINRGKFWLAVLIYLVFFFLVVAVAAFTAESISIVFAAGLIAYIPIIISSIAVGIKRLHDRNKTAWWLLVFYGIPLALPFVSMIFGGPEAIDPDSTSVSATVAQFISFIISVWALVELGVIRGTIGSNPYGPDPIAPQPAPQPRAH